MKVDTALCLAAGLIPLVAATGTLSLGVHKRDAFGNRSPAARGVYKRQTSSAGTVEESVYDVLPWSLGGAYYTNVSVGTPPQVQTVILDTGSSDLYFDASTAPACENSASLDSCRGGSFKTSASSTYTVVQPGGFNTSFGDGSTATGPYSRDSVTIGDVILHNVQMGIATEVDSTSGFAVGLMGLGYSANEATDTPYPNMPEVLVDAGVISSRLYSVFLNDIGDATGTILFGGIDTSKYTGKLVTFNINPVSISTGEGQDVEYVFEFLLAVTGLSSSSNGKSTTYLSGGDPTGQDTSDSLPVLLDTGSSAWTVPQEIYDAITQLFGNDLDQYGNIACSHQDDDISLTVEFGGQKSIDVPVREILAPVYNPATNEQNTTTDGQPLCTLMISPDEGGEQMQEQGFLTLGDAILRSMYVVFDLDNGQLSIAQAVANASTDASSSGSGSSIKTVKAGADGVANAVGSANSGVQTTAANSYTIDPMVSNTVSYSPSTVANAVGTATGTGAIPEEGRETGAAASGGSTGSGASGSTSTTTSSSSSTGAAPNVLVPEFHWSVLVVMVTWVCMFGLGTGLIF